MNLKSMKGKLQLLITASVFLAATVPVSGQTVTVTISADVIDIDPFTATIDDLPGPDGEVSFSEAMIATNNTPGHQTVGFAIPKSDWILQFILPGRAVLTSNVGFYFIALDEVTIDGTTQTEFTGDTNPDGWEVAIYGTDLSLAAPNCTLIGFDSTDVSVGGTNCLVDGNSGSMNISLFGGGGSLIANNTGGTIKIDRSNDNVVVGNTFQRVRLLGFGPAQPATNNRIGGPNPEDRNFFTGYGFVNSEGLPAGTTVQIFDSVDTVVENNWIGLATDGMSQGSIVSTIGIGFEGENHDTIVRNNRIAGILGQGQNPHHAGQLFGRAVYMNGSGTGFTFVGNKIGLDINDEPLLGSVWGFDIGYFNFSGIEDVQIGGTGPNEGNIIAGHIFNGITVQRDVPSVRISGNSIFDNGWLGIDLVPTGFGHGVTLNDPLDPDTGGNALQNFPEITAVNRYGATLNIEGQLQSEPDNTYTIEFFANEQCDSTGYGEGQEFLGTASVSTDTNGSASFEESFVTEIPNDQAITATATLEPLGATSEFSACHLIDVIYGDVNQDGFVDFLDIAPFVELLETGGYLPEADLNQDGNVDFLDIAPLVELLNGG